jgi:hypothetical protein
MDEREREKNLSSKRGEAGEREEKRDGAQPTVHAWRKH